MGSVTVGGQKDGRTFFGEVHHCRANPPGVVVIRDRCGEGWWLEVDPWNRAASGASFSVEARLPVRHCPWCGRELPQEGR